MLNLPLMGFYTKTPQGWALDQPAIDTWVRTIHDVNRPVVIDLSANGSDRFFQAIGETMRTR